MILLKLLEKTLITCGILSFTLLIRQLDLVMPTLRMRPLGNFSFWLLLTVFSWPFHISLLISMHTMQPSECDYKMFYHDPFPLYIQSKWAHYNNDLDNIIEISMNSSSHLNSYNLAMCIGRIHIDWHGNLGFYSLWQILPKTLTYTFFLLCFSSPFDLSMYFSLMVVHLIGPQIHPNFLIKIYMWDPSLLTHHTEDY